MCNSATAHWRVEARKALCSVLKMCTIALIRWFGAYSQPRVHESWSSTYKLAHLLQIEAQLASMQQQNAALQAENAAAPQATQVPAVVTVVPVPVTVPIAASDGYYAESGEATPFAVSIAEALRLPCRLPARLGAETPRHLAAQAPFCMTIALPACRPSAGPATFKGVEGQSALEGGVYNGARSHGPRMYYYYQGGSPRPRTVVRTVSRPAARATVMRSPARQRIVVMGACHASASGAIVVCFCCCGLSRRTSRTT